MKPFLIGFLIPIMLLFAYMGFCRTILSQSGEYWPLEQIYAKLKKDGGVYSSAVNSRIYDLKQIMYRETKPDVVALGSSRVLQFRKEEFTKPFVNLGNMHNQDEVRDMAEAVFPQHKPKVLILGVDFWWFSPIYTNAEFSRTPKNAVFQVADMYDVADWVVSGRLGLKAILDILAHKSPNIGIQGVAKNEGLDVAGSYINYALVKGQSYHYDLKFRDTLKKIETGKKMFAYSKHPDKERLKKMDELLEHLHQMDIPVIVFITPLAPSVADAMEKHAKDLAYVPEAIAHVKGTAEKFGFSFYNFHDPRGVGSSDCEMIDGFHGGPVLYARLLQEMVKKEKALASFVNQSYVDKMVATHAGKASFLPDETDFLHLGCKR